MLRSRIAALLGAAAVATGTLVVPARPASADAGWAVRAIADMALARRVTKGEGVKIALVGEGVDPKVRALRGSLEPQHDLVGTPRPTRRYDTVIASLLVGDSGPANAPGFVSGARLLPVRAYPNGKDPGATHWNHQAYGAKALADGITWAADHDAGVIAVDVSTFDDNGAVSQAVAYALDKNAVVVTATGMDREVYDLQPAAAPGVIAVASVKAGGERDGKFTRPSSQIALAAPASKTIGAGVGGPWEVWGPGVSLAWVTAAATMVRSKYPKLTPQQVAMALTTSARHPKGAGHYDTDLGFGYVNAKGALDKAKAISQQLAAEPAEEFAATSRFGGGGKPGDVRAAKPRLPVMGAAAGLALLGLALLGAALLLAVRKRKPLEPEPEAPAESAEKESEAPPVVG
ncbi:S8 family serine peptidase [Actinomadura parmotrematis]|uniref:S8 family serine peptidase n=1 Tax=Actinomadura parmotrematis TaxID=2864039 RepID=A0ABS7FNW0_9ACTN|nr:S8 family serine peptidase [Actinomadura parmotrematis]MBW8481287.1 S8 family serine peptidase [Actinomadura parmotrematis]